MNKIVIGAFGLLLSLGGCTRQVENAFVQELFGLHIGSSESIGFWSTELP
jgi:hypothetical protein